MSNRTADVANYILHEINSGSWLPGEAIQSQIQIAGRLGCSRTTVERAVAGLIAAGVLEGRRGSGTFVCEKNSGSQVREITVLAGSNDHSRRSSFVDMFLGLDSGNLPVRWMTWETLYGNLTDIKRRNSAVIAYMPVASQLLMLEQLKSLNVPILLINRTYSGFDRVTTDTEVSLREGISWLMGKAGSAGALISFLPDQERPYLTERLISIYELCLEFGIELPPERICKHNFDPLDQAAVNKITDTVFRRQKKVLALIVPNVELVGIVLESAAMCGKKCGKDFFLLTFDSFVSGKQYSGIGMLHQDYPRFQAHIEEWIRQISSGKSQNFEAKVKARLRTV